MSPAGMTMSFVRGSAHVALDEFTELAAGTRQNMAGSHERRWDAMSGSREGLMRSAGGRARAERFPFFRFLLLCLPPSW
eukprot:1121131-Prymnesium_polylepis.1